MKPRPHKVILTDEVLKKTSSWEGTKVTKNKGQHSDCGGRPILEGMSGKEITGFREGHEKEKWRGSQMVRKSCNSQGNPETMNNTK